MNLYLANSNFNSVSDSDLFNINGGNLAITGGIVAIGVCVVACGISAVIGFAVGGGAGAATAAYACAKETAPIWIGGASAIAGALMA